MQTYNQSSQKVSHLLECKTQTVKQASINEILNSWKSRTLSKNQVCQMQFEPYVREKLRELFFILEDFKNSTQMDIETTVYDFLHTERTDDVNQKYTKSESDDPLRYVEYEGRRIDRFFEFRVYGNISSRFSSRLVVNTETEDDAMAIGKALSDLLNMASNSQFFCYKILRYVTMHDHSETKLCLEKVVVYFDPRARIEQLLINKIKGTNVHLLPELPLFMNRVDNIGVGYHQAGGGSFSRPRAELISSTYYQLMHPSIFSRCCTPKPEDVTAEIFIAKLEKAFDESGYRQA